MGVQRGGVVPMSKPSYAEMAAEVRALRSEVKELKRLLAARDRPGAPLTTASGIIKSTGEGDWLANLPKQDRAFFERRLGGKK